MGCSNARLLVQAPLAGEPGGGTNNTLSPSAAAGATSPINIATDTNNTTTRMHLTGVDLVVERNGSYTLLLTPKTHKQLMPYVLRKKRFRILVDKPRSDPTNEPLMESNKELKSKSKQAMESTIESMEQVASDELNKANERIIGGRSFDRGNPEDEDENIQSDDEGMIEEIVTTIEEDKDLECKVKKKVETKKTVAQDPETHNKITKVVKTEVTEITRTITLNDQHDLARAKRELGIDDVNRMLPLSTAWMGQPRVIHMKEKRYEPLNEIVTSKDFPSDSSIKKIEEKPVLSEATMVGRGPVIETISSSPLPAATELKQKKKKKKSKLCSCTRASDDEQKPTLIPPAEDKKLTTTTTAPPSPPVNTNTKSVIDTQIQGQELISSDIKQLIIDKKVLLINYIHSKVFLPSKLFTTNEQDTKGRKLSSRILDLLRYDRCSSWSQMSEQLADEYADQLPGNLFIQPMIKTYENLLITKQSNLLNTFSTIHNENDVKHSPENYDYVTVVQTVMNERDNQPNIGIIAKQSVENMEDTLERLKNHVQQDEIEIHDEKVIDDDQSMKEINLTDDSPQSQSIYNEEQLIKMLADISQHKPITLAEAIAYEYIDIEDPKLGLSTDTSQRIKNLFRPLSDDTTSNLIRVKRSGEYLTDVNLNETNPFEKLNTTEPLIYQLQQTFEPTLDFNEKQFRLLTEAILNNKEQYDQLQFDIARTSLPLYDLKESSTNDFSQSDSGYSMTTATHESLASKIKIEFEPIHQDIPIPPKREDLDEEEKVDLDKATPEQLEQYELNHELIQIIKSDFNGSDKTIGQAILSRELRLDSTEPSDISRLNSLGINKEQARILSAFFFPKQTRIIAYSPEPGRFVEAQTTYNPDYPNYKTDTTIIQIQEKQLSSDHHAMQRNIYDDRTSPILSKQIIESETIIPPSSHEIIPAVVPKEKPITAPPPPPPPPPPPSISAPIKKRKSSGSGGLLSCFKSKKPKAGTEQQGQSTIPLTTQTSIPQPQQTIKPPEEKPLIDYAILPDGKRVYIDVFRDRPGLDMTYKPTDFDHRFVLPIAKPASEYERPVTPETESILTKSETPVSFPSEIIEQESITHHEPEIVEHKTFTHLEPRPATIEPVNVQHEQKPIVIPLTKSEDTVTISKKPTFELHGAAVSLPEVKLVIPGPLPTLSLIKEKQPKKVKTSTGGLCASCFGKKSAEKKKKEVKSESIQAPIEHKKSFAEEKKEDLSSTTTVTTPVLQALPSTTIDEPILPRVNIDQFKERTFEKTAPSLPKPQEHLQAKIEKVIPVVEPHYQVPISQPVPQALTSTTENTSVFTGVNIDQFKERTFEKYTEKLPTSGERLDTIVQKAVPTEEPHYQLPIKEPVSPSSPTTTNISASVFTGVNIDQFKERTFDKTAESLPKPQERLGATIEKITPLVEPHYQVPISEPVPSSLPTTPTIQSPTLSSTANNTSVFTGVNIDQFKERTFEKTTEKLPKSEVNLAERLDQVVPTEEPHYQLPIKEPVSPSSPTTKTIESQPLTSPVRDTSVFIGVNIDQFQERSFDKTAESLPKAQERLEATIEKVIPVVEPHYQLPINEPVPPSLPTTKTIESTPLTSAERDTSVFTGVNIDQFKERTFEKSAPSLPKPQERLEATIEKITPVVEPHYQLPINEPVPPSLPTKIMNESRPISSTTQDTSIFSRVNIDQFKERTFEKTIEKPRKSEEPHYQLPSGKPLSSVQHEYSTTERTGFQNNTYDIPRSIELQQATSSTASKTEEKTMISSATTDIQKSSGDFVPIKTELNEATTTKKKKKSKEPKQKSGFFSSFFRSNGLKSKVPALDLPSINRDLSPNNQLREPHRRDSDPLHVPTVDLPKLDLPLPTYDRPEVDMTTGQVKQSSEFLIPIVDFPPIPNLDLPENDNQPIQSNIDLMKIPNVQLPELKYTTNEQENIRLPQIELKTKLEEEIPKVPTIETGLALSSPVDDLLSIQTDHKNFPIETDYAANIESLISDNTDSLITPFDQKYTITDTRFDQSPKSINKRLESIPKLPDFTHQISSPEPILTLPPKESISSPPIEIKKKSSALALCSCFGNKSNISKEKSQTIAIPKTSLPKIDMPIPSSNISSTLETKGPLRAASNDLPSVDLSTTSTERTKRVLTNKTEAIVPNVKKEAQLSEEEIKVRLPTPPSVVEKQLMKVKSETSPSVVAESKTIQTESKKSSSFEIKAPVMNIPAVDLSGPLKSDAYISYSKQEETKSITEPIQSRSDSGLEAILSSHIHPSSTFGTNTTIEDFQQHPSISSGLGSEILDSMTTKGYTLSDTQVVPKQENKNLLKYDFTRKIIMNDETYGELKKGEISKSNENFDSKKDLKSYEKIRLHAIDLIKDKKVTTYSELQEKLIIEHKNEAFIVEPVVRSLYHTIEKPDFDRSESPLAIRDMACLPAKQTYDTVTHSNKDAAPLTTTQMTKETSSPKPDVSTSSQVPITIEKKSADQTTTPIDAARSCLTCGRSKSKTKLPSSSTTIHTGLLDERRRLQINTHRHELGNILRDHIQSTQPAIRKFPDHPKEVDKIIRKSLTLITQPKILSYEQLRNDLKLENKQTFYLIDPIIDIVRDTNDHCDITQMTEKINLDILNSNISQTASLYNNETNLLTTEEYNNLKSNHLSWLVDYLINNETKEKKLTKKQIKELNKILHRTSDILSTNGIYSWEELTLQLQREYPKANDLCNRSVELLKQGQKDGLLVLQQAPTEDNLTGKRRASSLITDRAKQNLKSNRSKIISSLKTLLINHNKPLHDEKQLDIYLNKTFNYLEEQKTGQFKTYNDLKDQLKKDFNKNNQENLIEQIVDVIEQAHATNQFDDIDKIEVQTLLKDRLDGKPLIIKEMYVSLPPRTGAYGTSKHSNDETSHYLTTGVNGDRTFNNNISSQRVGRGLSWREANERARILFYRGKHPAIHYDEQAAAFDVRMLLETASGGTQEIPVTDSDVHELLNSCGVQWDGVNIISLVDHSEDVVRAAEKAALKVIREKGIVELRTPPSTRNNDIHDDELNGSVTSPAATSSS